MIDRQALVSFSAQKTHTLLPENGWQFLQESTFKAIWISYENALFIYNQKSSGYTVREKQSPINQFHQGHAAYMVHYLRM